MTPTASLPASDLPTVATVRSQASAVQIHRGPLGQDQLAVLAPALAHLEALALSGEASLWGEGGLADTLSLPQSAVALLGPIESPIAYCLFSCIGDECEVLQIVTHPQHLRQGHGLAVLHTVFEHARERHCDRVFLEVRRGNRPARALYDRLEFQAVGLRRGYYQSQPSPPQDSADNDAILLSRSL